MGPTDTQPISRSSNSSTTWGLQCRPTPTSYGHKQLKTIALHSKGFLVNIPNTAPSSSNSDINKSYIYSSSAPQTIQPYSHGNTYLLDSYTFPLAENHSGSHILKTLSYLIMSSELFYQLYHLKALIHSPTRQSTYQNLLNPGHLHFRIMKLSSGRSGKHTAKLTQSLLHTGNTT